MTAPLNNLQSLVDAAIFIAGRGADNYDVISEVLVPMVVYDVSRKYAADPKRRALTLAEYTLAFTDGAATLPAQVLTEFLEYGVVSDSGDPTMAKKMRYISWIEFTRPLTDALGYFSVQTDMANSTDALIHVTLPGTFYSPTSGFTGNLTLTTPSAVTIPTVATSPINAPQEIQQDIVLKLAQAISGKQFIEGVAA